MDYKACTVYCQLLWVPKSSKIHDCKIWRILWMQSMWFRISIWNRLLTETWRKYKLKSEHNINGTELNITIWGTIKRYLAGLPSYENLQYQPIKMLPSVTSFSIMEGGMKLNFHKLAIKFHIPSSLKCLTVSDFAFFFAGSHAVLYLPTT